MSFPNLNDYFVPAKKVRPLLNVGCLLDIPNGNYLLGKDGESILNGGMAYVTGVGGRGNTFKSVFTHFLNLTVLDRHPRSLLQLYDTETSVTWRRMNQLAMHMKAALLGVDLEDSGRMHLSDNTVMTGNEWFAKLRQFAQARQKEAKSQMGTTPFIDDKTGAPIVDMYPFLAELDSLSMFMTDSVDGIYDKNQIGDGGANTDSLRGAAAKSQMLMQLPTLTGQAGIYLSLTMHVGDQHQLDAYAPQKKALSFLKGGVSFKHVPQKITFLTNSLYYVMGTQVLMNKGTKAPEYPKDSSDTMEGDTDLQLMQIINLRSKNGPTGMPFELVVSQSEGIMRGLSEFNYIKGHNKYGMGGHDRAYYLELLPDVAMQRTTVRGKIDELPQLRRALEITSEMCQMQALWDDKDGVFCSPKELYADLKAMGYDWDTLLNTRGYWMFQEDITSDTLPYLSTMDLLRMRKGLYHPKWHPAIKGK